MPPDEVNPPTLMPLPPPQTLQMPKQVTKLMML